MKEFMQTITEGLVKDASTEMPAASLYSVDFEGVTTLVDQNESIYDLLETAEYKGDPNFLGLAIVTCGWAAPLNANGEPNGAPSEHPFRRRVALAVFRSRTAGFSSVRFADDEEVHNEDANFTGTLWNAIGACLERFDKVQ